MIYLFSNFQFKQRVGKMNYKLTNQTNGSSVIGLVVGNFFSFRNFNASSCLFECFVVTENR